MMKANNFFACLFMLILAAIALRAWSCPDDLAERLYSHLKTKIEWVDVNYDPHSFKMTIRYYPCFSSRQPLDHLINKTFEEIPSCLILNQGRHQLVENYCVLSNIELFSDGLLTS